MQNEIKFIKPCRYQWEHGHRQLTAEYIFSTFAKGKVVQINLDNCAIQRMEQLPPKPTIEEAKEVGLKPLVDLLQDNTGKALAITCIGINEMPDIWVPGAQEAYERFCHHFWPGHSDDIEATYREYDETNDARRVDFNELSDSSRTVIGLSYVAFLQIQNIFKNYSHLDPVDKFLLYFHSIANILGFVSAFELEIAKYAFWYLSDMEINRLPISIQQRKRDIKDNFAYSCSSLDKCKAYAYNAAMDTYWLSASNLSEDMKLSIKIDGLEFEVDNWVGTTDNKLIRISNDIHSIYHDGVTMKMLATTREDYFKTDDYWRFVDTSSESVLKFRKKQGYKKINDLLHRIDNAVTVIENELKAFFSKV